MHDIALLWMRGSLSFLEKLCVKSFVDAGHRTILYSYEPIENVPERVELRDASEVLPEAGFLTHERTGSPALHSDLFRYRMLEQHDNLIWADTDAYCLKPFQTTSGHFHGWESRKHINGGVLGLPRDSATLAALLDFTRNEFAIPTWYGEDYVKKLEAAAATGNPVHAGEQPWGVWGPHAITHFLHVTGEERFSLPQEGLYPFTFKDRRKIVKATTNTDEYLTENTFSVHLYGRRMRKYLAEQHGGLPPIDGLLGRLLVRHGIDPLEAPLRDCPMPDHDNPTAKEYRNAISGKQYPSIAIRTDVAAEKASNQSPEQLKGVSAEKTPLVLKRVIAVTTMKNEGPYILDWIAYHLHIGFSHFLVYTNDCEDGTVEILDALQTTGIVTRIDNPADVKAGERPQRIALESATSHPVIKSADAYMIFDVDEYVNIHVGQGHLRDLFAACGNPQMISMTWRMFGCSGVAEFQDRPVPLQFVRCIPESSPTPHQNWGFKTIVQQPSKFSDMGVHRPLNPSSLDMPHWTNGSGKQMPDDFLNQGWRSTRRTIGYELVTLNHYSIRSLDSFIVKRDRGRTNHINRDQGIGYWNIHNRNDEIDLSIISVAERSAAVRELLINTTPGLCDLHDKAVYWHKAKAKELAETEPYRSMKLLLKEDLLSHMVPEPGVAIQAEGSLGPEPQGGAVVTKTSVDPALLQHKQHLLRTGNGDVVATGPLDDALYTKMQEKIAKKSPLLDPVKGPRTNERIVVITGMRNEAPFIMEWISYHLSIGVSHFLVYTNDCDDPTNQILDRLAFHGIVTRLDNTFDRTKGQKPQRIALNDAITQPLVQDADWYIPIDVDEFINIHAGNGTFSDLFRKANYPNIISMLWRFFGNADQRRYQDRWITETFTHCAPRTIPKVGRDEKGVLGLAEGSGRIPDEGRLMAWGFKTMIHKSAPVGKIGVHRPLQIDQDRLDEVRWVNGSGRCWPLDQYSEDNWRATKASAGYDLVTLNHYALRSAESYMVKKQRGRINHVDDDQNVGYWRQRNYLVARDYSIQRMLPRAKEVHKRLFQDSVLRKLHEKAVRWHQQRIEDLHRNPEYSEIYEAITTDIEALPCTNEPSV